MLLGAAGPLSTAARTSDITTSSAIVSGTKLRQAEMDSISARGRSCALWNRLMRPPGDPRAAAASARGSGLGRPSSVTRGGRCVLRPSSTRACPGSLDWSAVAANRASRTAPSFPARRRASQSTTTGSPSDEPTAASSLGGFRRARSLTVMTRRRNALGCLPYARDHVWIIGFRWPRAEPAEQRRASQHDTELARAQAR